MAATNPVELIPDFIEHMSDNKETLLIEDIIGLYEEYKAKAAQELEICGLEMTAQHAQDQAEVDRLAHPNMYEEHEQSLQQIERSKTQLQQKLVTLQADLVAMEADCKRQKSAKQTLQEDVAMERPNEMGLRLAMYHQLGFEGILQPSSSLHKIRVRGQNDVHTIKLEESGASPVALANQMWALTT